jgi:hypothetical protein
MPAFVSSSRPFVISLVAALCLSACGGGGDDSTSPTGGPQRGSYTVTLRDEQSVVISAESLTLQLTEVQDSRCPINALCIWAGHGAVALRVSQEGQAAETVKIGFPAPAEMKLPGDASYRGYRLSLQTLEPFPVAGVTVPLSDSRATVLVERAQ